MLLLVWACRACLALGYAQQVLVACGYKFLIGKMAGPIMAGCGEGPLPMPFAMCRQ